MEIKNKNIELAGVVTSNETCLAQQVIDGCIWYLGRYNQAVALQTAVALVGAYSYIECSTEFPERREDYAEGALGILNEWKKDADRFVGKTWGNAEPKCWDLPLSKINMLIEHVTNGTDIPADLLEQFSNTLTQDMSEFWDGALQTSMDEIAPEGQHWGCHEGDGACYGFWSFETD